MIEEVHLKQKKKEARQVIDLAKEMALFSSKKKAYNQREDSPLHKIEEQGEDLQVLEQVFRGTMNSKKKDSSPSPLIKAKKTNEPTDSSSSLFRSRFTVATPQTTKQELHVSFKRVLNKEKQFETITPSEDQSDRRELTARRKKSNEIMDTERSIKGNNANTGNYISTITNTIPSTIVSTLSNDNNTHGNNANSNSNRQDDVDNKKNNLTIRSILNYPKRNMPKAKHVSNSVEVNEKNNRHYYNYNFNDDLDKDDFELEGSSNQDEDEGNSDDDNDEFKELKEFDSLSDLQTEDATYAARAQIRRLHKKTLYEREMYNLKLKQERLNKQREHKCQSIENQMQPYIQMNYTSRLLTENNKYIPLHIRANQLNAIKNTERILNENKKKIEKEQKEEDELNRIKEERLKKTKGKQLGANIKVNWNAFVDKQTKWKNEVDYKNKAKVILEENKIMKNGFKPKINENTQKIACELVKNGMRYENDVYTQLYNDYDKRIERKEELAMKNQYSFRPQLNYKRNYIRTEYEKSKREGNANGKGEGHGNNEENYWRFLYQQYDNINNNGNPNKTSNDKGKSIRDAIDPCLTERISNTESLSKRFHPISKTKRKSIDNESFSLRQYTLAYEQLEHFEDKINETEEVHMNTYNEQNNYCQTEYCEKEPIPLLVGLPEMFNKKGNNQKTNSKSHLENTLRIETEEEIKGKEAEIGEDSINYSNPKSEISDTFRTEIRDIEETEHQTEAQYPTYQININNNASISNNADIVMPSSKEYHFLLSNMS